MKIQLHWLMALSLFSARWLQSQDVVGTWQGTLQADKDLRLVLKVSKADAGILKTTMYSIDEGGQSTAADASLRESIFKVTVPGVGERTRASSLPTVRPLQELLSSHPNRCHWC
jgi:hypothetical protein